MTETNEAGRILESQKLPAAEKRAALGAVIESVYPQKDGAEYQRVGGYGARVQFLPSVFTPQMETVQASGKKCCLNFMAA